MRKKILLAAILSCYAKISNAQNTFPSSGNVGIGTGPTTTLSVLGNSYSSLLGYRSIADFFNTSDDRARISILNGVSHSNHNKSSAIIFGGPNYAGTGVVASWELGTDLSFNGANNFYFYNNANGEIPFYIRENSNIGVQSVAPIATLQVEDGSSKLAIGEADGPNLNYGTSYIGFNAARSGGNWIISSDGNNNGGGVIFGDIFGNINFSPIATNGNAERSLNDASIKSSIALQLSSTGTLRSRSIVVETTNWPDYVFRKTYRLRTLDNLAKYIATNNHLPEMPTAKAVDANGVDVAETNTLLLKKMEELTLYVLQLHKEVKSQQREIKKLKKAKELNEF